MFINREISWLYFNERVLQEAADISTPLIERIKFLGIFSNNLDEFFRVRVATLKRMSSFDDKVYDYDGFDPVKILKEINESVIRQQREFNRIYKNIASSLEKHNISILNEQQLNSSQGNYVRKYFHDQVRPNLFPLMISNLNDSVKLKDKSIYLAVCLEKKKGKYKEDNALIKVPTDYISRFLILPKTDERTCIMLLDDVIRYCLDDIFSIFDFDTFHAYTIKFTRDAELDIDNDVSKSLMELVSGSLKQRKAGRPVRFIFDKNIPDRLLNLIIKKFNFSRKDDIIWGGRYHNFKDFINFPNIGHDDLKNPEIEALHHKDLPHSKSIFSCIRQKDVMLHFPYQSFDYIIDLLREASIDPKVKSIKMTLYRVAKNSNIVSALVNAARNGKSVTVYLELLARFDEKANIEWSQKLKEEGVKIIQGMPGLKVHAKLILIKRKEKGAIVRYANIGTGNFNEETAKIFADDSLLTCNPNITSDVEKIFAMFQNDYKPEAFKTLLVSPFHMRKVVTAALNKEIREAKAGKKAWVIIKLNNLVDVPIAKKLYQASKAGVKIKLIARGTSILIPGMPSLSENIEAISIVDKYLEHSRVMIFCNGGKEKYYITSADWMKRNFDFRIEVACPIFDPEIQAELKTMLEIQLSDNKKSRWLSFQKMNIYRKTASHKPVRSQIEIYNYLEKIHKPSE
jgi:polyphosphate kinase